ncbi:lactate utilization protein [Zhongshania borealis]|uniref:Lactate utilization protein n=1 Tax=Zhongshania borealis TaxID=889488 RepID=A0ABP7X3N4_9GAMM
MSSAREKIFQSIRRNKRPISSNPSPAEAIAAARANTIPARAKLIGSEMQALFERKLLGAAASFTQLGSPAEIPGAVLQYLADKGLRGECYLNGDVAEHNWGGAPDLITHTGTEGVDSVVCVTEAFRGIAETGSLVLLSAPGASSASHFLPEVLIVILRREEVLATQEAVWADLRKHPNGTPRTINLVTGPSRTGDIEQKIVLGAHGPRYLHVLLLG